MMRYVKKPIEVDAVQLTEAMLDTCPHPDHFEGVFYDPINRVAKMRTPAGWMLAHVGDWIVRSADGGVLPVRPRTFAVLFEPVAERQCPVVPSPN